MPVNAKAVVDIEIDDGAFKKFKAEFDKFAASIKQVPGAWKEFVRNNAEAGQQFEKMRTSLVGINQELDKAKTHHRDIATHAAMMTRHWENTKKHARDFAVSIKDTTLHLLKWTGIFSGIGGVLGSFTTLWGLTTMAESVRRRQSAATGVGLTPGQQKALELNYSPMFDVAGIQAGVEKARTDPRSDAYKAAWRAGINPRGQSAFAMNQQVMNKVWEASHRLSPQQFGRWISANKFGAFGITEANMEQAKGMDRDEWQKLGTRTQKEAGEIGFKSESARKWEGFLHNLELAGEKIKSILIDKLAEVMPKLEELTKKVTDIVTEFLKGDGFDKMIAWLKDAIDVVIKFFGKDGGFNTEVVPAIKAFGQMLKAIVDWWEGRGNAQKEFDARNAEREKQYEANRKKDAELTKDIGRSLGVIPEEEKTPEQKQEEQDRIRDENAPNTRGRRGGMSRSGRRSTARQRFGWDRDSSSSGGGSQRGGFGLTGHVPGVNDPGTAAGDIRTMMGFGWTYEQAVGIVTNVLAESGGKTDAVGDAGLAYGLAQWHPDRQAQFAKVFGHDIHKSTRAEQLKFIDWELNNTEKAAGDAIRRERTAGGAGGRFSTDYERPAAREEARRNRSAQAEQLEHKIPRVNVNINDNTGGNVVATASSL